MVRLVEAISQAQAIRLEKRAGQESAAQARTLRDIAHCEKLLNSYEMEAEYWERKAKLSSSQILKKSSLEEVIIIHYKIKRTAEKLRSSYSSIGDEQKEGMYDAYSRAIQKEILSFEKDLVSLWVPGKIVLRK